MGMMVLMLMMMMVMMMMVLGMMLMTMMMLATISVILAPLMLLLYTAGASTARAGPVAASATSYISCSCYRLYREEQPEDASLSRR